MSNLPVYLFHEGTNYKSYQYFGSHFGTKDGVSGVFFRVYAPRAYEISVVGDFNDWLERVNTMQRISREGVWECFVPRLKQFDNYKYAVRTRYGVVLKADPFAFHAETAPETASQVYDLEGYEWRDEEFCKNRTSDSYSKPMNVYEVNLLSWKKYDDGNYYSYRDLAKYLVEYLVEMNYTHVEFMPILEFPFDGSWGYQVTGYFAVTSRLGTPKDFMYLIDELHLAGIGVILDWVPAHFAKDIHGLYEFDGAPLYEDFRPTRMEHKGWGTRIFDYGRPEVQSFLISSAGFYFDYYHIDGIRVDAVASMLYLDYDRKQGEWQPNSYGSNYNLEAIAFLQKLNAAIFKEYPYALMIAEESTAFPMVTMPTNVGGLGFNYKWNMGWMNDTLSYIKTDGFFRKEVHNKLTYTFTYAFSENFVLPISHDEVVHGKGSLINKMPQDYDDKFENVKVFRGFSMAYPGKKLLFMGQDFGQFKEWNHKEGLEFFLLEYPKHSGLLKFNKDLNKIYKEHDALYSKEKWDGFSWVSGGDAINNLIAFTRYGESGEEILAIFNFSGSDLKDYRLYVDNDKYEVLFNSDKPEYGSSDFDEIKNVSAIGVDDISKKYIISLDLKKYSFKYLIKKVGKKSRKNK